MKRIRTDHITPNTTITQVIPNVNLTGVRQTITSGVTDQLQRAYTEVLLALGQATVFNNETDLYTVFSGLKNVSTTGGYEITAGGIIYGGKIYVTRRNALICYLGNLQPHLYLCKEIYPMATNADGTLNVSHYDEYLVLSAVAIPNATDIGAYQNKAHWRILEDPDDPSPIYFNNMGWSHLWGVGGGDLGTYQPLQFTKNKLGVVHIRGCISNTGTDNTGGIFTLPTGYRPIAPNIVYAKVIGFPIPSVLVNFTDFIPGYVDSYSPTPLDPYFYNYTIGINNSGIVWIDPCYKVTVFGVPTEQYSPLNISVAVMIDIKFKV